MAINIAIPKGTRDFLPLETSRRNYIFNSIQHIFQRYGFVQIETPAMENLSTLMGKYGEEGDKLIFKILNSGDFLEKVKQTDLETKNSKQITSFISEKALRYDLTVPFARYVVMNRNEITFPFKRYQIQPVWRADRPQKGRYREFYQCDVDIIGSQSLLNEVELIQIIDDVFQALGIKVTIKINNRKILAGLAEVIGEPDKLTEIAVAIDKADKIGWDKVKEELLDKGIIEKSVDLLFGIFNYGEKEGKSIVHGALPAPNKIVFDNLKGSLKNSEIGKKGIQEIHQIFDYLTHLHIKSDVEFDITLARGLNYYTGAIFEVKANDISIGSICGGGRYDDLTGIFGLKDVSGVGISFGADRIYDVLNELNLFPANYANSTQVLFVISGEKAEEYCLPLVDSVRKAGINAELYPDADKFKKQMTYANNKKIPFVVIVGTDEMKINTLTLKNMASGDQIQVRKDGIMDALKKLILF
jgi:histidyl-tRNA synthetase